MVVLVGGGLCPVSGKFVQLHFDGRGKIDKCDTQHYLLEKTRIVSPGPKERSFHGRFQIPIEPSILRRLDVNLSGLNSLLDPSPPSVFYQLCAGSRKALLASIEGPGARRSLRSPTISSLQDGSMVVDTKVRRRS